jgi:phenylacetate-CoA ligase
MQRIVRKSGSRDSGLRCECASASEALRNAIAATLRTVRKLGGGVELVAVGSLPNDGKVVADDRG